MKKIFASIVLAFLAFNSAVADEQDCYFVDDDECFYEHKKNFYIEVLAGPNFLQTTADDGVTSHYNTGYVVSGSLGYQWCYGFVLEAEYSYRRNTLKGLEFFGRTFPVSGHFQSSSYMGNLIWTIPLAYWDCVFFGINPFIGGGVGYDFQQVFGNAGGFTFSEDKKGFAWQVIGGLSYPLLCNLEVEIEYKFHKGQLKHLYNHSLEFGLLYRFGFYGL